MLRIVAYLEPKVYSECCLGRHIQAYLGIFDNASYNNYNNIKFLIFCTLILHTFQRNLKKHMFFGYNDVID